MYGVAGPELSFIDNVNDVEQHVSRVSRLSRAHAQHIARSPVEQTNARLALPSRDEFTVRMYALIVDCISLCTLPPNTKTSSQEYITRSQSSNRCRHSNLSNSNLSSIASSQQHGTGTNRCGSRPVCGVDTCSIRSTILARRLASSMGSGQSRVAWRQSRRATAG